MEFVTAVFNGYGGIIITDSLEESIAVVNAYARAYGNND